MRCKCCYRMGHTLKWCKNTPICNNCSLPPHDPQPCTRKSCVNCSGEHPSSSNSCPKYLESKELLKIKTDKKCSMRQAIQMYKESRLSQTTSTSYANVLSNNNNSNHNNNPNQNSNNGINHHASANANNKTTSTTIQQQKPITVQQQKHEIKQQQQIQKETSTLNRPAITETKPRNNNNNNTIPTITDRISINTSEKNIVNPHSLCLDSSLHTENNNTPTCSKNLKSTCIDSFSSNSDSDFAF